MCDKSFKKIQQIMKYLSLRHHINNDYLVPVTTYQRIIIKFSKNNSKIFANTEHFIRMNIHLK